MEIQERSQRLPQGEQSTQLGGGVKLYEKSGNKIEISQGKFGAYQVSINGRLLIEYGADVFELFGNASDARNKASRIIAQAQKFNNMKAPRLRQFKIFEFKDQEFKLENDRLTSDENVFSIKDSYGSLITRKYYRPGEESSAFRNLKNSFFIATELDHLKGVLR